MLGHLNNLLIHISVPVKKQKQNSLCHHIVFLDSGEVFLIESNITR
jgi:hypothetical protein